MATLWQVDDRASVALMKRFYGRLSESGNHRNPAVALAIAQRELRRSPQLRHPYYWAAYVVVGQVNSQFEAARTSVGEIVMNAWKRIIHLLIPIARCWGWLPSARRSRR